MHKDRNPFVSGGILTSFIGESIAKHSTKTNIGAHGIFLGQVRSDVEGDNTVAGIEFTCYEEMALNVIKTIREATFEKYALTCLHIHHSLGYVEVGQICLFVFASSKHRADSINAVSYVVERIKLEVPIWGKEKYDSGGHSWKVNVVKERINE